MAENLIKPKKISPDEIIARLNHSGHTLTRRAIAETIDRLPAEVQPVALSLTYVSVGRQTLGMARGCGGASLVILSDDVTLLRPYDAHSIVAHEIAHHWRGHLDSANDLADGLANRLKEEAEACASVSEWGFAGVGADLGIYQAHIWGAIYDLFQAMPYLVFSADVSEIAQWEAGWAATAARRWAALVESFNDNQKEIWRTYEHARKQIEICAEARQGHDPARATEPPKGGSCESDRPD